MRLITKALRIAEGRLTQLGMADHPTQVTRGSLVYYQFSGELIFEGEVTTHCSWILEVQLLEGVPKAVSVKEVPGAPKISDEIKAVIAEKAEEYLPKFFQSFREQVVSQSRLALARTSPLTM